MSLTFIYVFKTDFTILPLTLLALWISTRHHIKWNCLEAIDGMYVIHYIYIISCFSPLLIFSSQFAFPISWPSYSLVSQATKMYIPLCLKQQRCTFILTARRQFQAYAHYFRFLVWTYTLTGLNQLNWSSEVWSKVQQVDRTGPQVWFQVQQIYLTNLTRLYHGITSWWQGECFLITLGLLQWVHNLRKYFDYAMRHTYIDSVMIPGNIYLNYSS